MILEVETTYCSFPCAGTSDCCFLYAKTLLPIISVLLSPPFLTIIDVAIADNRGVSGLRLLVVWHD